MDGIYNAIIVQTNLGSLNDKLVFNFTIAGDNWNCSYQGEIVDINAINYMMQILGVPAWEKLQGHSVRVKLKDKQVINVGNFLSDKWLMNNETVETMETKED